MKLCEYREKTESVFFSSFVALRLEYQGVKCSHWFTYESIKMVPVMPERARASSNHSLNCDSLTNGLAAKNND